VPDLLLVLTEELAVVDNLAGHISLIVYADPSMPDAYESGRAPR
jgi:anthranilate synthase component 1